MQRRCKRVLIRYRDLVDPGRMATLKQKIAAEQKVRELLEREGMPLPDRVEYGYTCVRLFWTQSRVVLIVDIDELLEAPAGSISARPADASSSAWRGSNIRPPRP